LIAGIGWLDSPNNVGLATSRLIECLGQQVLSPKKVEFELTRFVQQTDFGGCGQFQCRSKVGGKRNGKHACHKQRPTNVVKTMVKGQENTSNQARLEPFAFNVIPVLIFVVKATWNQIATAGAGNAPVDLFMSTTAHQGLVVNAQGGKDQQDTHDVVKDNEQSTKDGKHFNGGNGANGRRKKGHGGREGRQEHGRRGIGQGDGGHVFGRFLGMLQASILPFVHRDKDVACNNSSGKARGLEIVPKKNKEYQQASSSRTCSQRKDDENSNKV
jgi:hypothetical protein